MRIKSGILLGGLSAIFTACSSAPKQEAVDATNPPVETRSNESASVPIVSVSKSDLKVKTVLESAPVPKSGSRLGSRYRDLSKAVRSGHNPQLIQEEAAKILVSSADDPVALNSLAMVQILAGRSRAGKLLLARAIEKNTSSASLHNNMGVVLLLEGDQDAAIVEFKKALRIDDEHPEASGNLGGIYARGGDLLKAYAFLETAYKSNPSNVSVANNYALALKERKDFEDARKVYEAIYKTNKNDVSVVLNYAALLIEDLNRPKEGLDLVYRVKFLESDRKDVLARVNALEKKVKSELK